MCDSQRKQTTIDVFSGKMEKLFVGLILTLSLLTQVHCSRLTYRAAVVEYHPENRTSGTQRVEANLAKYVKYIEEAKRKKADIIVFPESGLATPEYWSYVPDPLDGIIPCNFKNYTKVLTDLSCASKTHSIYSVVNLAEKRDCAPDDENCPQKGFYVLNTNVVFDRVGRVIARYSKYNLFDESGTDRMKDPEIVFFDTDFGVRFGTFICFDILFASPAQKLIRQYGITDFVFPTFWFSELPFLSALQTQRGWAETNNVNLLASGVNNPKTGSGGSGIYNGKFGQIVQVMPETAVSKLLVADVPIIEKNRDTSPVVGVNRTLRSSAAYVNSTPVASDDFELLKDQMNLFSSEVVETEKKFEKTICHRQFCCDFEVSVNSMSQDSKDYTLRAVAFHGVRRFGKGFTGGVQTCGVVMCDGPKIENCVSRLKNAPGLFYFEHIFIKGNFKLKNSFQMPSTLTNEKLEPLPVEKYNFVKTEDSRNMAVSLELVWPVTDLQTFAIWGRDYTKDMLPIESGSSVPSQSASIILISFISYFLFVR